MRSHFITSALTIALAFTGSIVPAVGEPIATPTATQQQTSEIDRAIAEGERFLGKGTTSSYKQSIVSFERALALSRSANVKDKQAYSLLGIGIVYDLLEERQKALVYLNQSLQIRRELGDRKAEGATLRDKPRNITPVLVAQL